MTTLTEQLTQAARKNRQRAARAFVLMPPSHQQFIRDVADLFGKPAGIVLTLGNRTLYRQGE